VRGPNPPPLMQALTPSARRQLAAVTHAKTSVSRVTGFGVPRSYAPPPTRPLTVIEAPQTWK
jgi:hypothetical protein